MAQEKGFFDDVSGFFNGIYDTAKSSYEGWVDGVKAYNEGRASIERAKADRAQAKRVRELETGSTASTGYDETAPVSGRSPGKQDMLIYAAVGLVAMGLLRK